MELWKQKSCPYSNILLSSFGKVSDFKQRVSTRTKRLACYCYGVPSIWKHQYREGENSSLKVSFDLATFSHITISGEIQKDILFTSEINLILVLMTFTQFKKMSKDAWKKKIYYYYPAKVECPKWAQCCSLLTSKDTTESERTFIFRRVIIQQFRQ